MSKDINLLSFNGPEWNGKRVEHYADIVPSPEISDTLKFTTSLTNFYGSFGKVVGGKEDCVDINDHCENVTILGIFHPKGKYGFTIKGGSKNIAIGGDLVGHGSETDVDIGNISDQSDDPVGLVTIALRSPDTIRVRVIYGTKLDLANEDTQKYEVTKVGNFFGWIFTKVYKQLKKVCKWL